ncbi:MAG: GNAT family N-acetyltransferase [Mangrovibacterium sp.]
MLIRKAQEGDLTSIWSLVLTLAENEGSSEKIRIKIDDLREFLFSQSPCLFALVAENNSDVVGIALYYYRISTWIGKTLHLEDLVVSETSRGKGIGTLLFKAIAKESLLSNCFRLDWEVSFTNEKGRRFYDKLGADFEENWRICRMEHQAIIACANEE